MLKLTTPLVILPFCLLVLGCQKSADGDTKVAQTAAAPAAVSASGVLSDTEWALHGLDVGEQRYSPLDQITRDNVSDLGLAWSFDLYTRRGVEATPLMVDGTLYVSGSWSMVYALDARTGELKWFHDPQVDRSFLAKGCCDAVNRGVAYSDGKIIVATYDGRLVALKAVDGEVVWDVQTTDRNQSYTISGAPRIVKDKVIIGNGGAELGVRGYVSAYYISSGEMAWRFYTVPGNPADGFENEAMAMAAETWTGEWWKFGGGGTAWDATLSSISCTSVSVTAHPGTRQCAVPVAAIICSSRLSWRLIPTPGTISGTTRPPPAIPGITPLPSTLCSRTSISTDRRARS